MHDIDFDEIDRAVNSVTNRQQPNPPQSDGVVADSTRADDVQPVTVSAPSLAARRSSGRFMDVVHPSSDMRASQSPRPVTTTAPAATTTTTAPSDTQATRPAVAPFASFSHHNVASREQTSGRERSAFSSTHSDVHIQPSAGFAETIAEPAAPVAVAAPEVEIPSSDASNEGAAFHWPDPIELSEANQTTEPAAQDVVPVADTQEDIDEDAQDDQDIENILSAPLESPFLSDAKVEKRPLGAFSGSGTDAELPLLEDFPAPAHSTPEPSKIPDEPIETVIEETEVTPETFDEVSETDVVSETTADIPRELHKDVLLLDTHGQDEPVPELLDAQTVSATSVQDETPVGPSSITQQYKEQPSTAAQPSGSIYDTSTYHQPLAHPAKKRSSLLVIVWIIALILVGGGIGAGFYFVVLPMLG